MADTLLQQKKASSKAQWQRVRSGKLQLLINRRKLRGITFRRRLNRRRLKRRLRRAIKSGAYWRVQAVRAALHSIPKVADTVAARADKLAVRPPTLHTPAVRSAGPGRCLLLMRPEQGFIFSGICRVTCLYGQVQILGYTISQGQPPQDVFSTYTHTYLTINSLHYFMPEKSEKEMRREARNLLRSHLNKDVRCWAMTNFSPLCSFVLLEHLETPTVKFIASHPGFLSVFFQENQALRNNTEDLALKSIGIKKGKKKGGLSLTESFLSTTDELVSVCCEEADGCPIILVCGPQNVGKSTFNRYLINRLLNCLPCVDYLECDLGQSEFTTPGCISLLNITEPVLGPPFTHQRTPQKMVYYGIPSCKRSYENFIEIVKYVFSAYKKESPLIINTMGWVTDEGLLLLIDLIRLLSPSHVIQFDSSRGLHMPELTPDFIDDKDGLYTKSKVKVRNRGYNLPEFTDYLEYADEEKESPVFFTGYKLMCIKSNFIYRKTERNRGTYNKILRDLTVLGYLSKMQPPVPKPLCPLQCLTPYQVPFNAIALRVIHAEVAPTHILYAVNASWVGLCKIMDDVRGYTRGPILLAQNPICDCVGFGICRGIDMEKRLYHILTPVPPEELRNVNCLLVGAISIPHCVFWCQRGTEGTIPYVTTDYNLKLPGATGKIGARECDEKSKVKLHPKPKLYRKLKLCS